MNLFGPFSQKLVDRCAWKLKKGCRSWPSGVFRIEVARHQCNIEYAGTYVLSPTSICGQLIGRYEVFYKGKSFRIVVQLVQAHATLMRPNCPQHM
jgi:hypothetical protein